MWEWIKANWKIVVIFVVISIIAVGSALDGYKTRRLLKAAQVNIEEAGKAKEKELKKADEAWGKRVVDADRKLAPVLRERDDLRAKLAARDKIPFDAPDTDAETVTRWRDLGYQVRMGPCR